MDSQSQWYTDYGTSPPTVVLPFDQTLTTTVLMRFWCSNPTPRIRRISLRRYTALFTQLSRIRCGSSESQVCPMITILPVVLCSFQISISSLWSPMGLFHFVIPQSKLPTNSYQLVQDGLTNVIISWNNQRICFWALPASLSVPFTWHCLRTSGQSGVPCTISWCFKDQNIGRQK